MSPEPNTVSFSNTTALVVGSWDGKSRSIQRGVSGVSRVCRCCTKPWAAVYMFWTQEDNREQWVSPALHFMRLMLQGPPDIPEAELSSRGVSFLWMRGFGRTEA